jgi:arginine decarboxylase
VTKKTSSDWTIHDSDKLYNIGRWGDGYFSINEKGHLCLLPEKDTSGPCIDMSDVIDEISKHNIQFPVVLRFHDILRAQVINLNKTFRKTIDKAKFQGEYYGVFPIKVNQMREVVEEVLDAGQAFNHGLEVGSKPELLAALALNTNLQALTILNGYKDEDYLRLALIGRKLGRKIIVVIEKYSELPQLIELSKEMDVIPLIGIRAKMATQGSGKWSHSSGEMAKFGLTIPEIFQVIQYLEKTGYSQSLKLFHFHIGSQVPDIRTIKDAITEGARIYATLVKMGVPLEYFDVGGGLGVDYDGSRTACDSSTNYTLTDYTEDVVYILKQVCDLEDVEHPHIVSETGRAIAAHHSCVVVNVFGKIDREPSDFLSLGKSAGEHVIVNDMRELFKELRANNLQETYFDALQKRDEMISAFKLGVVNLLERAKIEIYFEKILNKISQLTLQMDEIPKELGELENRLADQYLCNFSIFQSAPDSWAIGQLLPITPIKKLNERPTRLARLADITCDSDGKIDRFIDFKKTRKTLPLHKLKEDEPYYIGLFLTGAYQDIMGDVHNLFGRLNEVHIFSDDEDPSDFYIEEIIHGNTAEQVLSSLQYGPQGMASTMKKAIDKQVQRGKIRPREGVKLTDFYEYCLRQYTYLKK